MKEDLLEKNLDTLQKFGTSFQTKAISCLLNSREFLEQTYDIVVPHYFDSESNKWIVDKVLWYFGQYKSAPTMDVFKQEVDKLRVDDVLRVSVVEQLKNVYKNTQAADLAYVQNEFLTFCKNQAIKNAVLRSADMLERGKYDEIKSLVDRAMRSGQERNIGHNWTEDLETRISKLARDTIATPWPCINQLIDGGLGPGELGCIIAPSGIGKSWILCALGTEALKRGKRVVHYTFELSENYVGLRYDTIITGIEPAEIKNNVDRVKREIDKIDGELIIKYFPTRSASVNHLYAHINRMTQLGYPPDLVIVDYADLMRSTEKSNARHEELGFIYEELRGMLGELKIPGWTASQSQRSALQDDVVEADKIAGAYSKIFVCDVIMSASRKLADKVSDTARIHMIKNRFGADGMTFPATMDLSHGQIKIFDENSVDGIKVKGQMASGAGTVKAMLQKKLMDVGKTQPVNISKIQKAIDDEDYDSVDLG
jgi:replicative DNA helicase